MKTTRSDKLEQYLSLLDDLRNEKAHLEGRLEKINAVLTGAAASRGGYRGRQPGARQGRRARNGMSLREAVTQVTRNRPLTKEEILQGIQKLGYRFSTKDPMNSLNAMLYAPANKFRNQNGRFGPK